MHPILIIFGSISTLVDTSELQREAFNQAFSRAGLDWTWTQQEYQTLLERPGGRDRVADYAKARGHDVDAKNIHAMKTEIFDTLMAEQQPPLRDGVKDVVDFAQENSILLAFASSSSRQNIEATLKCFSQHLSPEVFSLITDGSMVEFEKPSPQIYEYVLKHFDLPASQAIAVEDTEACLLAATQAHIPAIAFPNTNAQQTAFKGAMLTTTRLAPGMFELPQEAGTASA